ncbi:APC family permease [Actinomadura graeca]|uniref:APC family permease n=1 Tax=Actinomadura graeca TaxID=2750812 RepID=A0ABX8QRV3_9ACTN|nr:APC family permease [Actinomadura graeca]QXJ21131.1 APC family permease [Actinomadura graeca]
MPAIIFFVVAAVGPMSGMMGASALVFDAAGPGAPMVFVLMTIVYVLFVIGYSRMSHYVANAGGFVAYIARAFGEKAGSATAATSVLMYTTLLCSFYGIFGVLAQGALADVFHWNVKWYWCVFVTLALVSLLSYRGVDISLKFLTVLLVLEIIALGAVAVAIVVSGGGESGNSVAGFAPSHWLDGNLGVAMLWAAGVYVGIEATVVFSEEARDRRKTIPRAAYGAVISVGVFYVFVTWALSNAFGLGNIAHVAMTDPNGFIFEQAEDKIAHFWSVWLQIQVITSFFAVLLGLHNILARYFFSLGRAGLMPSALGRTHATTQNPHRASAAISVILGTVLILFTVCGADPYLVIYEWLIGLGTIALLVILALTSLSVPVFFRREQPGAHGLFATVISPIAAAACFVVITYMAIRHYDSFVGSQDNAAWLLLLIPVAAATGLGICLVRPRGVDFAARLD